MFVMTSYMKIVAIFIFQYGIVTMGLDFKKIDIPDLEPLFRKRLNSERLQVINSSGRSLLPVGENFQSLLVQLNVTIRRDENAKEEELHLVAKTNNAPTPGWSEMFKKEVFAYLELLPAYRNIERGVGVSKEELIDFSPRYFGHRYSLDLNIEQVDKDLTFLMDNLSIRGYKPGDKRKGLSTQYAKKALSTLARYHALGIALRHKQPNFFEKVKVKVQPESSNTIQFQFTFGNIKREHDHDPSIWRDHFPAIKASYENGQNLTISPTEPWGTVIHGDFGAHNLMFLKDSYGNVKDVKFLDYQLILFHSGLKDVAGFLCLSLNEEAFDNDFDALQYTYYAEFHKNLRRLRIDTTDYTRESFDKEMKKRALEQLPWCVTMIKLFSAKAAPGQSTNDFIQTTLEAKSSESVKNKFRKLVRTYERKGWF